jgi:hypothetical protein
MMLKAVRSWRRLAAPLLAYAPVRVGPVGNAHPLVNSGLFGGIFTVSSLGAFFIGPGNGMLGDTEPKLIF